MDFSAEELRLLRELVESAHGDLREEIYKAEDSDFKGNPKQREQILESLLEKVRASSA